MTARDPSTATETLSKTVRSIQHISVPDIPDNGEVLSYATDLSNDVQPDLVLTALFEPDFSTDKHFLTTSSPDNTYLYSVQSYWN